MSALALVEGVDRVRISLCTSASWLRVQPTSEGRVFPGSEKASEFPVDTSMMLVMVMMAMGIRMMEMMVVLMR